MNRIKTLLGAYADDRVDFDCLLHRRRLLEIIGKLGLARLLSVKDSTVLLNQPVSLFGLTSLVEGEGRPVGDKGEVETMFVGTQRSVHDLLRTRFFIDNASERLGFNDDYRFAENQSFLEEIILPYFSEQSDSPAILSFTPTRVPSNHRHGVKPGEVFNQELQSHLSSPEKLMQIQKGTMSMLFENGTKTIDLTKPSWGYLGGRVSKGMPSEIKVKRHLKTASGPFDYTEHWTFLAQPDDFEQVRQNRIPAVDERKQDGLQPTPILGCTTFHGTNDLDCTYRHISLEFSKEEGALLSIRRLVVPLATARAMSPSFAFTLDDALSKVA